MKSIHRTIALLLLLLLPLGGAGIALAQQAESPPASSRRARAPLPSWKPRPSRAKPASTPASSATPSSAAESEKIVEQFKDSIHMDKGFSCADCHGGDPSTMVYKLSMSPERGFIGKPGRMDIPKLCSRCHSNPAFMKQYGGMRTDQLDLYKTSMHGIALYTRGDLNVAVCTDCHTTHHIASPKNPKSSIYKKNTPDTCGHCHASEKLMAKYGLDYTIPEQYKQGEHGKRLLEEDDLGAPVCNDCHGNHGAMPPGVASIEHVCGQCHLQNEQYYDQSKHAAAFAAMKLGRCVVCHEQHALQKPSDDFFNPKQDTNCGGCHAKGTPVYATILGLQDNIKQISGMHATAESLVQRTEATDAPEHARHDPPGGADQHQAADRAHPRQHSLDPKQMASNLQDAGKQFKQIEDFTLRLLERSKFNKFMVALLAVLLFGYGIYLVYYKKAVLMKQSPAVLRRPA